MQGLPSIFKAYDIRGLVPEQLNFDIARSIGESWARLVKKTEPETSCVLVGRDMRPSGRTIRQNKKLKKPRLKTRPI